MTINVLLVGERGVGKSSIINLIAQKDIAKISSDVDGCTTKYQCHEISFDDMDFAIFDTVGLDEPQMGVEGNSNALDEAYKLIDTLCAAGGIHLVLFCMRGRRITEITQRNYHSICGRLCNTKVPVAPVFTYLEAEDRMEDWWGRNKAEIERYGIASGSHACITTVHDDTPKGKAKYNQSQETIRKLLKNCALKETINVVLFGESGIGKSAVANLVAQNEIANDVEGCTMDHQRYNISIDNTDFTIFDTVGLDAPQMRISGYLETIEKTHDLVTRLRAAGGVHLLLFCMSAGYLTTTKQNNYRLFCEFLCNTKVPIALVIPGLEKEVKMDDWWRRNESRIKDYGIKSDGHACVTAVLDGTLKGQDRYTESQETIRKLLKTCAHKRKAFSMESQSWLARVLRQMKTFLPAERSPTRKDIMDVLIGRCKLDVEAAKEIADTMELDDV